MSAPPEWKNEKISLIRVCALQNRWDSSYMMRKLRKERRYCESFLLRYGVRKSYYNSWLKLYGGEHNRNYSNEFLNEACKRSLWLKESDLIYYWRFLFFVDLQESIKDIISFLQLCLDFKATLSKLITGGQNFLLLVNQFKAGLQTPTALLLIVLHPRFTKLRAEPYKIMINLGGEGISGNRRWNRNLLKKWKEWSL